MLYMNIIQRVCEQCGRHSLDSQTRRDIRMPLYIMHVCNTYLREIIRPTRFNGFFLIVIQRTKIRCEL